MSKPSTIVSNYPYSLLYCQKGGIVVLLTAEIERKLEANKALLQKSAVCLARCLMEKYPETFELRAFAIMLGEPTQELLSWLSDRKAPSTRLSWKLLDLADQYYITVDRVIRGKILDEYNLSKRIPLLRSLIRAAKKRVKKEGVVNERKELELCLTADNGRLSFFGLVGDPGPFKMWIGVRLHEEELFIGLQRISVDEAALGGNCGLKLPSAPVALTKETLPVYDPDYETGFTIADVKELIRWVHEGRVVDKEYLWQCQRKSFKTHLKLTADPSTAPS